MKALKQKVVVQVDQPALKINFSEVLNLEIGSHYLKLQGSAYNKYTNVPKLFHHPITLRNIDLQ